VSASGWGRPPGEYHDGLQALRGILALGVFAQHLFWQADQVVPGPTDRLYALSLGGLSVLTFFALSGYLIPTKASDPPIKFLLDRGRRVFPIFWLALVLCLPVPWAQGASDVRWPWAVALLLPTGVANTLPLPHWSLYFEAFFYVLVLLVALMRASWVRPAVVAWGAIGLVVYERPYDFANYNAPDVYNLIFPLYALFFAAGVLAGWRFRPTPRAALPYALAALTAFYGLQGLGALGVYVFAYLPRGMSHQDAAFVLVALGSLCAVRAALCWRARSGAGRVLRVLGDASYGIYLVHILSMMLAAYVLRRLYVPSSYWVTLALVLALALPPALLVGLLDVRIQRALKGLQRQRANRAGHRTLADPEATRAAEA
jgi:exopolysaccharide production protein ExoZ